jgi:hypothetical protein
MLVAVALLAAACGGDAGGGAGDRVSDGEAQALCGDFGDRSQACGWNGNVNGADWNCGEAAQVWRADVFRGFVDCAVALPCDGDGQTCYTAAYATAPRAIHDQYGQTCQQRSAECELTAAGDASAVILLCDPDRLAIYATSIMDEILACFDETCDAIVTCLDAVL